MGDESEKDVLSSEVSAGLEVSVNGKMPIEVKGKAKSRFISAIDRLAGNIFDFFSPWLEAAPAKKRAATKAEIAQIAAKAEAAAAGVPESVSKQFVRQAAEQTVARAVRNQEKKILLLREAIEDLKQRPPSAEESARGAEALDESFLNRLERRAEEATEGEIRAKWAKVLAAETRSPGTFSVKVMRIIDEIAPETAELFQRICKSRIGQTLPACCSELESFERIPLENESLLIPFVSASGLKFKRCAIAGEEALVTALGSRFIAILKEVKMYYRPEAENAPIAGSGIKGLDKAAGVSAQLYIPASYLTKEGEALASIFGHEQEAAFRAYLEKLSGFLPETEIAEYKTIGKRARPVQIWRNGKPQPVSASAA